jgi:flagellar basal-body rod protein FlgG
MFHSLETAATGMSAQETNLDTIANNLANANTVGYKRQQALFEDLLYQTVRAPSVTAGIPAPVGLQVGAGSRIVATARQFSQGTLNQTGNQLDLAIEGNGFFAVTRPTGDIAYTRAGSLQLDSTGRIVTPDGLPLDPTITVPAAATSVTIASDGTVTAQQSGQTTPTSLGQIQLATFPNPSGLEALGHNLFLPTASSGEVTMGIPGTQGRGTILQGSTEASNVDVVTEMIGMIQAQRTYEINSKVVSAANDMLQSATQLR